MRIVYEVIVAAGHDADSLLSEEVIRETQAQVMTPEQARAVGLAVRADPSGREIRLVAVPSRDARFVQRRLESSAAVLSFRSQEIDP